MALSADRPGTALKHSAGFTLLELMVVVVIIGIMATFASLSIGGRLLDDTVQTESRRLRHLIELTADEALFQGVDLGLRVETDRIEILMPGPEGHWIPYAQEGLFRARDVKPPMELSLQVEARDATSAPVKKDAPLPAPSVLFLSSGDVTPFALFVGVPSDDLGFQIDVNVLGQVSVSRPESTL